MFSLLMAWPERCNLIWSRIARVMVPFASLKMVMRNISRHFSPICGIFAFFRKNRFKYSNIRSMVFEKMQ